jgi:hypothetical protein
METQDGTGKDPSEANDENQIEKQFISSHAFHRTPGGRIWEITVGEWFEPRIIESFDPVTQELYLESPTSIQTQHKRNLRSEIMKNWWWAPPVQLQTKKASC